MTSEHVTVCITTSDMATVEGIKRMAGPYGVSAIEPAVGPDCIHDYRLTFADREGALNFFDVECDKWSDSDPEEFVNGQQVGILNCCS